MQQQNFTYQAFDRQVRNLISMASAVIDGWDEYNRIEMNLDLKSLNIKASKLCHMTDEDRSRQMGNIIVQDRQRENHELYMLVGEFVEKQMAPFVMNVIAKMRSGKGMIGENNLSIHQNVSDLLPQIAQLVSGDNIDDVVKSTIEVEKVMKRIKPTTMPGMTDVERFWLLYELLTMVYYLLLHFQTMNELTHTDISPDEVGHLLLSAIQQYSASEEGEKTLKLHLESLRFDHGGELTKEVLQEARRALRKEVPERLQLCFMQNINNLDTLGRQLLQTENRTSEEIKALLVVVAKWQMLTHELEELQHPRLVEADLPNEVFHTQMHDRRISMRDLRERIARMLPLITRKNHWFCLWSVLRYHNLIADINTEAFARQMLSPQWFGTTKGILPFTGDTLREYAGYFTDTTFRTWNTPAFNLYRQRYNKTKWSETLCSRFQHLCEQMNEEFTAVKSHQQREHGTPV